MNKAESFLIGRTNKIARNAGKSMPAMNIEKLKARKPKAAPASLAPAVMKARAQKNLLKKTPALKQMVKPKSFKIRRGSERLV